MTSHGSKFADTSAIGAASPAVSNDGGKIFSAFARFSLANRASGPQTPETRKTARPRGGRAATTWEALCRRNQRPILDWFWFGAAMGWHNVVAVNTNNERGPAQRHSAHDLNKVPAVVMSSFLITEVFMFLKAIRSGAQTGADRAGLDAAITLGLMTGGWIPKGRRTEDGPLSMELFKLYRLTEHPSFAYPPRTEQNVRENDATVIFGDETSAGSILTIALCKRHGKPYKINPTASVLRKWLVANRFTSLNVAGNRESTNPGMWQRTYDLLIEAIAPLVEAERAAMRARS
jgi:hypothetical protein